MDALNAVYYARLRALSMPYAVHGSGVGAATRDVGELCRMLCGPHGIALIDHARAGGEAAAAVVAYLEAR